MRGLVLSATHETKFNSDGREVPLPLVDVHRRREPYLTTLTHRLHAVPGLREVWVVTNETIRPQLDAWAASVNTPPVTVRILGDGTKTFDERKGAIGDLIFALRSFPDQDDLLVVGGDNWFKYDLADFAAQSEGRSPSVVVTSFRPNWGSSRFGVVERNADGRLTNFLEKPSTSNYTLKASCVYYFSRADQPLFDTFEAERLAAGQTTRCTPGQFLEWLVKRGNPPVYGIETAPATTERAILGGGAEPDTLELTSILRRFVQVAHATWEKSAARWIEGTVGSYESLLEILRDADPNKRIVAARMLGLSKHLLDASSRDRVIEDLVRLLSDPATNDIGYDSWQGDDESMVYVSATAAETLVRFDYAPDAAAVFARARQEGAPVAECYNEAT